jgi:AcrR family transcriptional regulator
VASRTFFRHFRSKESVLFGDPRALEMQFRAALSRRPPGEDPTTALRAALVELANTVVAPARDRHLLRHRILHEDGEKKFENRYLDAKSTMLREVIAERIGADPTDTRAELLGGIAVTVMDVAYREWIEAGAGDDIAVAVERTFDTLDELLGYARTRV